ncbi:MAG: PEP-CTERM system TPR-repeat protein PrsT [Thiobacillus sp.]|nr:PEP-CTERM system TPR-repeat protein PrsT [Thiobacillus sp.]
MNRRTAQLITLLVLALSAPLGGCDATAKLTEQEHIQRAKDFEDKGNLKGSIIELKNAILKNPDSPQARLLLGQVYLKAGMGAEAEKELSQAVKLGVNLESIKPQLGEALMLMGEYQRVLDEIHPADQTSKTNLARIYQVRADALLRKGQLKDACNLFQQSFDTDTTNPPTYWGLAQCAVAGRDSAKAREWLDAALKLNSQQAKTWIFIGDLEQLNKNADGALAAYSKALQAEPDNQIALNNRAILNVALGQLDQAQADVDKTVKLAPQSLASNYLQALLNFERKQYPEARERLQAVFKITNDHMPSILLAGATDYALGSYKQAESHLVRYLARNPGHSYGRRVLAATQLKQKDADKALETLAPLLTAGTLDVQALVLAGEAYRIKRDPSKAAEYLARASEIDPKDATIQAQLGFSHLAAGDSQLAIAELTSAASLDAGQHRADVLLAMAHLDRKEYDKALAAIDALEKKLKNSALPNTLRGNVFMGKEDLPSARKSFEHALAIDPAFFPAVASLAQLDIRDNKPEVAQQRLERFLDQDKQNLQATMALAELAGLRKQEKAYVSWLDKAVKDHPTAIPPRAALVRHHLVKKDFQKALAIANETLRANPDSPAALDLLGSVQLAMNDTPSAISTFTKLTQQAAQSPDAHLRLATAQIADSKMAAARATLHKALKLKPDHEPSLDAMIRLEMNDNKPAQALQIARQLQADRPQSPLGFEREGDIQLNQKRPALAIKAYEQALAKGAGSSVFIKSHRAHLLAGSPAAAQQLANWLAQHPKDNAVRFYAAEYYAAAGRHQDAIAAYQVLLTQAPGSAIMLNNLANSYQQVGDKRALETAEQAYKLNPEHPAILDTLGWLLVEKGQAGRGLELIEKALAKAPGNPDIRYHRAMALLAHRGDKARVRKELESLLKDAPAFSQAEAAKAQLQKL